MNIKLLRLQTGEDIIAEVKEEPFNFVLKNPCVVYIRPGSNNNATIGLTRWIPYAESKEIKVDEKWVVVLTDPAEDLKNEYNKAFGSGIIVPPTQIAIADK